MERKAIERRQHERRAAISGALDEWQASERGEIRRRADRTAIESARFNHALANWWTARGNLLDASKKRLLPVSR